MKTSTKLLIMVVGALLYGAYRAEESARLRQEAASIQAGQALKIGSCSEVYHFTPDNLWYGFEESSRRACLELMRRIDHSPPLAQAITQTRKRLPNARLNFDCFGGYGRERLFCGTGPDNWFLCEIYVDPHHSDAEIIAFLNQQEPTPQNCEEEPQETFDEHTACKTTMKAKRDARWTAWEELHACRRISSQHDFTSSNCSFGLGMVERYNESQLKNER